MLFYISYAESRWRQTDGREFRNVGTFSFKPALLYIGAFHKHYYATLNVVKRIFECIQNIVHRHPLNLGYYSRLTHIYNDVGSEEFHLLNPIMNSLRQSKDKFR